MPSLHESIVRSSFDCLIVEDKVSFGLNANGTSSGDYIVVVTPVPIPNTVVKHSEPMIVLQA